MEDEDDDDDSIFSSDEDEADLVMYNQLLQEESSRSRRRSDAPRKKILQKDLVMGAEGSKRTTLLQILFSVMSSSVEGKILLLSKSLNHVHYLIAELVLQIPDASSFIQAHQGGNKKSR
jgi:hypothetical protein